VEGFDGCLEGFLVDAHVWFDLVVPLYVFAYAFESTLLLLVYAVESLQLPIGLRMVYSGEDMFDSIVG